MRLWVFSDAHLELSPGWDLPPADARPDFDVLVVAGDLIPGMENGVKWLRERVLNRPVIYIPGNHEFYGTDEFRTVEKAKAAAVGTNVHVLQCETIRINGVTFAGATTWTDFDLFGNQDRAMRVAEDWMNDYRKIRTARFERRFRPHHAHARHLTARTFFESEMRRARSGKLVVVSHHAPHPGPLVTRSNTWDPNEIINAAYRSDLTALMHTTPDDGRGALKPADIWIYGHTHESEDTLIGHTRVVTNAKGYGHPIGDNRRFDPKFVIEI